MKQNSDTLQWYTKHEQGFRMGMIFGAAGAGQIFGGVVAYGIAQGTSLHPAAIPAWKIVFLVTGLLTMCVGVIFLLVVPDNQLNAWWLSKDDRRLAIERVRINQQGIGNKHFKMYQLKEALTDPLTWAFVFYVTLAGVPNGGITNFFSQLIVSFGYTPQESLLYGGPGGAVAIVSFVALGYLGDHYGNRILFSCAGLLCGIFGLVLIVALPLSNNGGRLAGYYLTQAGYMPYVTLLSLIGTNVAGYTKKTTVAAMFLVAYTVGDIIGEFAVTSMNEPA
jgi:ACS family allantoate permease-like MFS transporter